jgi:hypothetical protein
VYIRVESLVIWHECIAETVSLYNPDKICFCSFVYSNNFALYAITFLVGEYLYFHFIVVKRCVEAGGLYFYIVIVFFL